MSNIANVQRTLPYFNIFGTADISSAQSIDEALQIAMLDWEVESKEMFDANGNKFSGYKANVRKSDGQLLGVVGERYRIVQNHDAFDFIDGLVADGLQFDKAGQFRDGRSIWVMGSLPQTSILGDDVDTNIVFTNSHDGTSGVKIMMTPVRIVCSNMLNLALRKASRSWATRHTGGIFSKLEEAKHTLNLADKYMDALKEEADRLTGVTIADAELEKILEEMFPIDMMKDSAVKIRNTVELRDTFKKCYDAPDIAQYKGTAYGVMNAISDMASHKSPTRLSDNFYENAWNALINGHPYLDKMYKRIA